MVYCKCGLPPEYCEFGGKTNDNDDCKKWLAEEHPELHEKIYPSVDEETKEGEEVKKKKKKQAKIMDPKDKKIRVILLKRGGKKIISNILGLEFYNVNLADCARLLAKKFACGAAAV